MLKLWGQHFTQTLHQNVTTLTADYTHGPHQLYILWPPAAKTYKTPHTIQRAGARGGVAPRCRRSPHQRVNTWSADQVSDVSETWWPIFKKHWCHWKAADLMSHCGGGRAFMWPRCEPSAGPRLMYFDTVSGFLFWSRHVYLFHCSCSHRPACAALLRSR